MDTMTISHNWTTLEGKFFSHKKGPMLCFTKLLYAQNAQIFMKSSNMNEKHEIFFTPPPYPHPARVLHVSLVTHHSGEGEGWEGGRYAQHCSLPSIVARPASSIPPSLPPFPPFRSPLPPHLSPLLLRTENKAMVCGSDQLS